MPDTSAVTSRRTACADNISDRNSALSRTFSALRWFLALIVVADHFFRQETIHIGTGVYDTSSYPAYVFICRFVESYLKNYAVPVFFFMSGYLAFKTDAVTCRSWMPHLRRRLRGLAVPFVIFSLFGFLMRYSTFLPGFITGRHPAETAFSPYFPHGAFDTAGFISDFFGLSCYFPLGNVPLWYIRDLACLLILLPLLHSVLRKCGGTVVLAALCMLFLLTFHDADDWRPQVGLLFFTAGLWMRSRGLSMTRTFSRIFPYAAVLYPLLATAHMIFGAEYPAAAAIIKNINICLAVPLTIYSFYLCVGKGWIKGSAFLASASFFIYVIHSPVIWAFKHTALHILSPADNHPSGTMTMLAAFLALIAAITALYACLSRLTPRLTAILSGSRA